MDFRVSAIQIFVNDYRKAKEWYGDIMGMELVEECSETQCAWMKLGNIDFYIETPNPGWGEGWDKVKVGGRTPVIFETDDIENTVRELKEKKVRFVEEVSERSWGEYKAVFSDPDGNEFNLVQEIKNENK